ncbi:polyphosphate polymerase domain-containing protein [Mobilitalea sibirica]|uniref:Polyphosphate polymerase domain-containing protein n=1 Tax=Mobilitalea sibirica TaxID=1462919 RepID=A0A8J7KWI3_9FIRM|nr:polyphosphate polymerase domain-containing protein [Mobilitalea sibirica]MBH1940467.1 polyphosphate polymerase domain-containing protein [Mobilitalea sibirica]
MAIEVFNRHEIKYMITDELFHSLRTDLEDYMEVDSHSKNGEFYSICNVYYDTPDHTIIRRSIDKPSYKEKLRLRSYGVVGDRDKVYLEIKKKHNGFVNKRRTSILHEEAVNYIASKDKPDLKDYMNGQVLNEIDYFIRKFPLGPTLYLSYDRYALFGKEDHGFRITFDTNIRTRREEVGLDKGNYGDLLLSPGVWIMEAKMEKAAPVWFAKLLASYKLYPSSFSKYGTEYKRTILHK